MEERKENGVKNLKGAKTFPKTYLKVIKHQGKRYA
jgi:hypothetical protein